MTQIGRNVNRADVICEAYPGASNDIQERIAEGGGLVCENHPWVPWEDGAGYSCGGAGMIRADAVDRDGEPS
jgi:hypothetical protein